MNITEELLEKKVKNNILYGEYVKKSYNKKTKKLKIYCTKHHCIYEEKYENIRHDGRLHHTQQCEECKTEYRRRNSKYVQSAWSGEWFYISKTRYNNSKNKIFFQNKHEHDLAQRMHADPELQEKFKKLLPSHYGKAFNTANFDYRTYCINFLLYKSGYEYNDFNHTFKCPICEKTFPISAMEVHHIDHDPTNNDINNLILICGSCHNIHHYQK